ncbi:unnamed protein product [Menidia menidia]|uniref:(Atlantic silverside) hypothetical protein n=1 Tax=Menidia menidia TaxID=238744 RepID=A0A8S4B774_9TELE|nr:unnamed protein product [Menidia menidia]
MLNKPGDEETTPSPRSVGGDDAVNIAAWHVTGREEARGDVAPDYDRVLLRVAHIYEEEDDPELSRPVVLDLKAALAGLGEVEAMEERSLTGTWDATRLRRWKWNTAEDREEDLRRGDEGKEFTVTIWPKQIRTFFVHFASRKS